MTTTECQRCSAPLKVNLERNPDARLLRHSLTEGVCANCATTAFLKTMEPIATVLQQRGPEILCDERVANQFAAVLAAGDSDAKPGEVDWGVIVAQWDLS